MSPVKLIRIFLYCAVCACWCVFSVRGERLSVRVYTSADGLGSSFVNYLMRDSRGFLWICTRDGLSRFDGFRFVTYQIGDKNAPPGIEQILETRKGIYWIGTTAGLYRFDPNSPGTGDTSPTHPTLNAEFVNEQRGVLFEDHAGNLWLGSTTASFTRVIEEAGKISFAQVEMKLPPEVPLNVAITAICEGNDASLWVATHRGVVRRFADGSVVFFQTRNGLTAARGVQEDASGRVWVGTTDATYVILPEAESTSRALRQEMRELDEPFCVVRGTTDLRLPVRPGEIVKYPDLADRGGGLGGYLYRASDGHIWISTLKSVIEFDGRAFHRHTSAEGFIEGITQFAEDAGGSIWLGGSSGLMRLDRTGLGSYFTDGLSTPNILVVNQTRDGKLYVMTRDLSLSVFDGRQFQTVKPALPTNADVVWMANTAYQDSAGEWWFPTSKGLYRFSATNDVRDLERRHPQAVYDSRNGLKSDVIFHLWEDSNADLWISMRGTTPETTGLARWSRAAEKVQLFTEAEGFPSGMTASAFAQDRTGNIWLGFSEGGLVRFDHTNFTRFNSDESALPGAITQLHVDRSGRLWIASAQNGLSRIDDPTALQPHFAHLTTENGLSSNNVRSLTEDLFGRLYAGTARGVDRISADVTQFKHYSISDGLAGDFVSSGFCDSGGVLWFGTPNGLSKLVPRQERSVTAPPILISGLHIAGEVKRISELGSRAIPLSELSYSQNNLQIDFFGIDFSAGESLRYQYKLEGADQNWSTPSDERSVTFANLQPGTYRFLVRAVNAEGTLSPGPAIVTFKILPPFWKRWWFLALATLLFGVAAYALYRYRVAQIIKVERVRTRIATDLHDDIGASLSRVAILSEVVRQQAYGDDGEAAARLEEIAGSARDLVDSMSDIVWSVDPRRDNLANVVTRLRQFGSDVFEAQGIAWELRVAPQVERIKLAPEQRRDIFLICKEALNNVARHANCKHVTLSANVADQQILIEIRDDGDGFRTSADTSAKSGNGRGGHGLVNMRARAARLGADLQITSGHGQGTQLKLLTPRSGRFRGA